MLRCEPAKRQSVLVYYGDASQLDISGGVLSVLVVNRSSIAGASDCLDKGLVSGNLEHAE